MLDYNSYIKTKRGSERSFGLVFAVFFMIIAIYPLWKGEEFHLWALFLSITFLLLGLIIPRSLVVLNKIWFKLGMTIGKIVAPFVMGIIFFLTVTPTGMIMRLIGKDILKQKIQKSKNSYWINREEPNSSMENQF